MITKENGTATHTKLQICGMRGSIDSEKVINY
jgi:hypothetical protein